MTADVLRLTLLQPILSKVKGALSRSWMYVTWAFQCGDPGGISSATFADPWEIQSVSTKPQKVSTQI